MRSFVWLCVLLVIGLSWPVYTWSYSLLDIVKKDPRYQALTPDQQKDFDSKAMDLIVDQFNLYTNCQPLAVFTPETSKPEDLNALGLTKATIHNAVESRLRATRIYAPKFDLPSLRVSIFILRDIFSLELGLIKPLSDTTYSQMFGAAKTWEEGSHGGGSAGRNFILSGLSRRLDHFIAEYLRVNEEACAAKR